MPPEIDELPGGEWLINSLPRLHAPKDCQPILTSPRACVGCPLATKEPESPPSPFLQHLVYLAGLQDVGARFDYGDLSISEWHGLRLLKTKRDEKSARDLKAKR